MAKKRLSDISFDSSLVLFRYFLNEIGVSRLSELSDELNTSDHENYDSDGYSFYYRYILSRPNNRISSDSLRRYDENITRHLKHIGERRGGLRLKYFQYFSLLFTEIFLDRYFSYREEFLHSLNTWLRNQRDESVGRLPFKDFNVEDLRKIAFMCATGSGKTLIMHINILQYLHYFNIASRKDSSLSLNKIILITPNEAMSRQHLEEFALSGIDARMFSNSDNGMFSLGEGSAKEVVTVIDIHKLDSKSGDKKVSVECFESNNLVLVDEAHRGLTSGDAWIGYRRIISENGFTFEYSATLKQSINANARSKKDKAAFEEYAKAIIMDYSYKFFYDDGYGKDFSIFNLETQYEDDHRHTYLIGCLLSFYQQLKYYDTHIRELSGYNIEKPLLVFVGSKVLATTSEKELSDIQEILLFFDRFLRQRSRSAKLIENVLKGESEIIDEKGEDIFFRRLNVLKEDIEDFRSLDGDAIYRDILKLVFNSSTTVSQPRLRIENLKLIPGEIALKVGKENDVFGVISIGESDKLVKACERNKLIVENNLYDDESFFDKINESGSKINLLIGSRKFTEGWNSWRVSTMGLINFAKSEGSQAIQLFGRGVRLKGLGNVLKRSSMIEGRHPKNIGCVETLWIFGIKARYMATFRELIEGEGMEVDRDSAVFSVPVGSRYNDVAKDHDLKVLRLQPGKVFKTQAPEMILNRPDGQFRLLLSQHKIEIDCRSRVSHITSSEDDEDSTVVHQCFPLPKDIVSLLDYYRIYSELIRYKHLRSYHKVVIVRERLADILLTDSIYGLIIPEARLKLRDYRDIEIFTDFAILVLKSYMERFYRFHKAEWEDNYLEYSELKENNGNFIDEYVIRFKQTPSDVSVMESLENFIYEITQKLSGKRNIKYDCNILDSDWTWSRDPSLCLFDFGKHLYSPLLALTNNRYDLRVTPVGLNEGEKEFVFRLKRFCKDNKDLFIDKSLFLMRNKSRSGIGFFEAAGFHPDFIVWIDTPDKQYISFVDPKGLLNVALTDPKLQLYAAIKNKQDRLQPRKGKKVILNSFILSVTDSVEIERRWDLHASKLEEMNILFLKKENCIAQMISRILSS